MEETEVELQSRFLAQIPFYKGSTMSRLTNEIRYDLRKKILNHGFLKSYGAILKEEQQLAKEVYDVQYPAAVQKHMQALPDKFLPTGTTITVYVGGQCIELRLKEPHRFAYKWRDRYHQEDPFALVPGDQLADRCLKWARAKKKQSDEYQEAKLKTKKVLESVTTLKKLIEVWPEIEVFVMPFIKDKTKAVTALAVPIASLNRVLDLPPDSK
jgi:hypothetical protein